MFLLQVQAMGEGDALCQTPETQEAASPEAKGKAAHHSMRPKSIQKDLLSSYFPRVSRQQDINVHGKKPHYYLLMSQVQYDTPWLSFSLTL